MYNDCINPDPGSTIPKDVAKNGYALLKNRIEPEVINFFKELSETSYLPFENTFSLKRSRADFITNEWRNGSLSEDFRGRNILDLIKHNRGKLDKNIETAANIIRDLVESPDISAYCEQIIGIKNGYKLGLIMATLMYSFPGCHESTHSEHALIYHVDYHGPTFCKLFIPITPLDELHGTHSFIKTSHSIKPRNYQEIQKDKSILIDEYDTSLFVDHMANPGDLLIENTNGYHRGTIGEVPRILLSITVGFVMGK